MIEICPFAPEHASGVANVILPIQQCEFGIPISLERQPDLAEIQSFYQSGAGNFWVALSAGEVVGTIGLLDIGSQQAALRKMFVKPAFRGPTHQVAARLLDKLLQWGEFMGLRAILFS